MSKSALPLWRGVSLSCVELYPVTKGNVLRAKSISLPLLYGYIMRKFL